MSDNSENVIGFTYKGYRIVAQKKLEKRYKELDLAFEPKHYSVVFMVDGEQKRSSTMLYNHGKGDYVTLTKHDSSENDEWLKQAAAEFQTIGN